jgi:hypothetical protein
MWHTIAYLPTLSTHALKRGGGEKKETKSKKEVS